jgi:hypothetical protein
LASHANDLSSVAGNQVWVIHLIQLQQPMSNPTNEPSREPICKPTKRMDLEAELPNNLSSKNKQETCSDDLDYEIHNKSLVECNSQLNKWRMPVIINLDFSGLRCSAQSAVLSRRDKVYSHSILKSVT